MLTLVRSKLVDAAEGLFGFFIYEESSRKVALFRIALGTVTLLVALTWFGKTALLFTDAGYLPTEAARAIGGPLTFSLFYFVTHPLLVLACYLLLLIATVLFIMGTYSRVAGLVVYVLFLSFCVRNLSLTYGGTMVLQCVWFYALFLQTDKALVPKWYARKYGTAETVPGWPVRMIQVQLAIVYLFAGLSKARNMDWNSGQMLWYILNNPGFSYFDVYWLRQYPVLNVLPTYFGFVSELIFPFWIWLKQTRRFALALVTMLHVGIFLTMNVHYFSEIMLACLITCWSREEAEWVLKGIGRAWKRVRDGAVRARELQAWPTS